MDNTVKQVRPDGTRVHIHSSGLISFFMYAKDRPIHSWIHHKWRHRARGPALINPSGVLLYVFEDRYHRTNGPATIDPATGRRSYYIYNKLVRPADYFLQYGVL